MKSKLFIAMVAVATLSFVSCEKEEFTTKEKEASFVVSEVNSIIDETGGLKSASSQWGTYPLATNTYNSAKYFGAGTYAVKITRNGSDGSTLTMRLEVQNQTNLKNAYVWAYKNDANNNQLYYSGICTISIGESAVASPIPDLSITGSQSIIYVFKVVSPGYYIFCYRKMS